MHIKYSVVCSAHSRGSIIAGFYYYCCYYCQLGSKLEAIKSYRDANFHCLTELLRCFQMLLSSISHAKGRFHFFIFWKSNLRLKEVGHCRAKKREKSNSPEPRSSESSWCLLVQSLGLTGLGGKGRWWSLCKRRGRSMGAEAWEWHLGPSASLKRKA